MDLTKINYAESRGANTIFDWGKFLKNAVQGDLSNLDNAISKAGEWITCACGVQCAIIPRRPDGGPEDHKLWQLGLRFYSSILGREFETALEILRQIETRSAELITEINSKK